MTAARIRALALVALAALASCSGSSPAPPEICAAPLFEVSDAPARYAAVASTFAAEARASGAPGAVLGIVEDGRLAWAVGVGCKVPYGAERVAATTSFRIGSVTKMMTALAVLQEVDAGRVSLEDPVVQHVPGFHLDADDVSAITVRELLDQTAALSDYLEVNAPADEQTDAALASFLTGRFSGIDYLMAPPGRFWNYSNPNYMLAGLVAESSSGVLYRQLMAARVFGPLGMDRTFFTPGEVLADGDYAEGATTPAPALGIPAVVAPDSYENPWGRPAGYAWSNAADLARFAGFLLDGDPAVLSPALHAEMTSPTFSEEVLLDLLRYGYGLVSQPGFFLDGAWRPAKVLSHGGNIPGFSSFVLVLPEARFAVVMLASGDTAAPFESTLAEAIRTLPALPAPAPAPDLAPDPTTFGEEVGVYVDPHLGLEVTVSLSGGQLRVDAPGVAALGVSYDPVLQPVAPRNFLLYLNGAPFQLTFVHGATGEPTWMRTRIFVAARAPGGAAAATPANKVGRARLDAALRAARIR